MKPVNQGPAEIRFNVDGPLLSLEQMRAAYVLYVYEAVSGRNITRTAKLLQSTRVTTRKLVDLGAEDRAKRKAAEPPDLWPDLSCPKCKDEMPWRQICLKNGIRLVYCENCGHFPDEEKKRCRDTPTSSRSP